MPPSQTNQYRTQQILSASGVELVAMLHDKAVSCLRQAIGAIERGDIKARYAANSRAREIVEHLWITLEPEKGGDVAANLDRLYRFMLRRLLVVDVKNDAAAAQEVIDLIEPLRASWHGLVRAQAQAAAPAAAKPASEGAPAASDSRRRSVSA
jgi:flagellar secretion chaperone FliS